MENENDVILTAGDVKALGYETIDEVTKALKNAKKAGDVDKVVELQKMFEAQLAETNGKVAELQQQKNLEAQEEVVNAASEEKALELFKSLSNDDPKKLELYEALSKDFGASTIGLLSGSELKKSLERPLSKKNAHYDELIDVRKAHDLTYLFTAISGGVERKMGGADAVKINWNQYKECAKQLAREGLDGVDMLLKGINEALDTQTATEGAEWIPTMMSGTMADDLYLQLRIAPLFTRYAMTSKSWEIPLRTARARPYRVSEATVNTDFYNNLFTAHNLETDKVTFEAEKIGVLNFVSEELEQDSILPVLQILNDEVLWGLASGIEDAILNGSSLTTDLDNAAASDLWTSTADVRNAWDGIRKAADAHTSTYVDGGTFALTVLRATRKKMGKYGVDPTQLAYITGPIGYSAFLGLDEVTTVQNFGAGAVVKAGQLGEVDGVPIIVSEHIYENLNASGLYDNITTDNTIALLVYLKAFAFGDRRQVRVETDRAMLSQQRAIVSSWRGDFQKLYQSGVTTENVIKNIAI